MKSYYLTLLTLLALSGLSPMAIAQAPPETIPATSLDKEEHLLDGTSFTFQYQNAGAMDIAFADGFLTYTWIAGRNAGEPERSFPYKSRKVSDDVYLVNWHEPDAKNFVTMVYNFKSNSCAVSVISRYGSEKPFRGFQGGVIENVKKE